MRQRFLSIVFILLFMVSHQSWAGATATVAKDKGNYSVSGIKVSETAATATAAKEKATLNAKRQALRTFLGRIGADPRFERDINNADLESMVSSMNIFGEQITNDYYSASITINFDPNFVRYVLTRLGIYKNVTRPDDILFIPVYVVNGVYKTQRGADYWTNIIDQVTIQEGVRKHIRLPFNNNEEVELLNAKGLVDRVIKNRDYFFKRYGVDQIFLAEALRDSKADTLAIKIRIIARDGKEPKIVNFTPENGSENMMTEEFFRDGVKKVIAYFNIGKIDAAATNTNGTQNTASLELKIRNVKDWVTIRGRLLQSPIITDYEILAIESDRMAVKLSLSSDATQEDIANEISEINRYLP